jgi:tRNA(adenine34) deaminase
LALLNNQESTPMNDFMSHAVEQAKIAQNSGDLPFGAVVVCDNKIVGYGRCTDGTTGDVTDHAEINALRMACKTLDRNKLQDCEVYSTSEPCPMCASAIFQAKIPKIIMGVQRQDLLHLLRQRNIGITELAQDAGYEVHIEQGTHSAEILGLFAKVDRKKARQLHPSK